MDQSAGYQSDSLIVKKLPKLFCFSSKIHSMKELIYSRKENPKGLKDL